MLPRNPADAAHRHVDCRIQCFTWLRTPICAWLGSTCFLRIIHFLLAGHKTIHYMGWNEYPPIPISTSITNNVYCRNLRGTSFCNISGLRTQSAQTMVYCRIKLRQYTYVHPFCNKPRMGDWRILGTGAALCLHLQASSHQTDIGSCAAAQCTCPAIGCRQRGAGDPRPHTRP